MDFMERNRNKFSGRPILIWLLCMPIYFAWIIPGYGSVSFAETDYNSLFLSGKIPSRYMETSQKVSELDDLLILGFEENSVPFTKPAKIKPDRNYWLKLDFADIDLSVSEDWVVRFIAYDRVSLYYRLNDSIVSQTGGKHYRSSENELYHSVLFNISKDNLIDDRYLYARVNNTYRRVFIAEPYYWHPFLTQFRTYYFTIDDIRFYSHYLIFIGGMMLMFFYSLGIFFMNRDVLHVYYAVYLLSLVLYLGMRLPLIFGPLELRYPLFMSAYNDIIQVIVNITYLLFAAFFLNARQDFPRLNKAIQIAIAVLGCVIFFQLIFIISVEYTFISAYILQAQRYGMIIFTLIAYVHILMHYKKNIVFFLLIGSFFYLTGAVGAMYVNNIKYMMLGTAIEVFIFSLGMGYRIKLVEKDKKSIEDEIAKVRLTALKAQMNPHFIFNSLNSIRAQVIANDTRKASEYIRKFAHLIRLILQYSSRDTISLEDEINALKLYVELEGLRFRENFHFEIIADSGMKMEKYLVPPLILQPYVENAIGHGLVPKKGEKLLQIEIQAGKNWIWFRVRDNGVGRAYSGKIKTHREPGHESMAMDLTRKRIDLTNPSYAEGENIYVNDLSENGKPVGTEVCIRLPVKISKEYYSTVTENETESRHY